MSTRSGQTPSMGPKKMNDFQRILAIWTTIATNTRLRDRMVKVIQYGSQMLIGYYGAKMSEELLLGIRTTRRSASTARKAFWLLKSINHINSIVTMIDEDVLHQPLAVQLDFIEQVSLVFYYLYENGIFFARCNMFGFNEDDLDWGCNVTWFIGDVAFFLSSGLRLHANVVERKKLIEQIVEIDNHREAITAANGISNSPIGSRSPSSVNSQLVLRRRQQLETDIQQLSSEQRDLLLSFAISILEIGVSMHYVDIFKMLGRPIGDGEVGAMGVGSSTLILIEGIIKATRALQDK